MYYCRICNKNHHGDIDGYVGKKSVYRKEHLLNLELKLRKPFLNNCLNCFHAHNNLCEMYREHSDRLIILFSLDDRIDIYNYWTYINGCCHKEDLFSFPIK